MSSVENLCSICQRSLGNEKKPEVKLSCKHRFHRKCASLRLTNGESKDCPVCRKKSALEYALRGDEMPDDKHQAFTHEKIPKDDGDNVYGASTRRGKSSYSDFYEKDSSEDEWECSYCAKDNSKSLDRCKSCGKAKYSSPSTKGSSAASPIKKSHDPKPESYKNSGSYGYHHSNSASKYDDDDYHPPINRQQSSRRENLREWICDECEYVNQGSDAVCKNCRQGKQSESESRNVGQQFHRNPSPAHHSPATPHSSSKSGSKGYAGSDYDSRRTPSPATPHSSSKSGSKGYAGSDYDSRRTPSPATPHSSSKSGSKGYAGSDYDSRRTPSPATPHSSSKSGSKGYAGSDYGSHTSSPFDYDAKPAYKASSTPKDTYHTPDVQPKPSKGKPSSPIPQDPVPVYIANLPLEINDDDQLENHIRKRVEKSLRIDLSDIKCYAKLGVGIMYVADNQTKERLTQEIVVLAWDPKDTKTTISFVETLNLVSYIVLDMPKENPDSVLPTAEEISRRWAELNNGQRPHACEGINVQFPNIYRLESTSLDQLIRSLGHQDFKVKNQFAQIYFCADCSYFEDVPRSITQDQLQDAVIDAIKQPHASLSTSLHVQLNKQAGTACIIAANAARKWATINHISINGKPLSKKDKLACRLLIHHIPNEVSLQDITQHPDFNKKATIFKQSGDSLILDILDKSIFDDCIKRGVLRVGSKYRLNLDPFTSNNSDGTEIDGDSWYNGEMLERKPDIMPFVADPDHFIFRCKWNAGIWLDQFQQATPEKFGINLPKDPREQRGTAVDELRHRLQMTVMLNTLASIRQKRYFIKDREIKLNINDNLQTIVYNHESQLEKSGKMPMKTPFPATKINVVGDDCIAAYEKLVRHGKKPLLLNMASATSPGGGFRKGDGAQEENLFRRSDYFRSLDVGLDGFLQQRSERLLRTSDGQLERLPKPYKMYPMDEYGAIYTSGLTFFRHSQDVGYEYMSKPIENVCAVAMAAYRDPKLEGRLLSSKYAVGTRKKLENIFSIAYHHGHDSIVLSAFGCGAFRNPPIHIAKIFYSVIEQYAGFFDTIVFAIIDDHNAGQKLNPEGNYKPFSEVLDGKNVVPLAPMNKPNTMFGPYRVSSDGSRFKDINIFDSHPCWYAAKCSDVNNPNHTRQYSHPPMCAQALISGKCNLTDNFVHINSFIHRKQCSYGGECRDIDDPKHSQELEHPQYCSEKGSCRNMTEDHLRQYRHVKLCKKGTNCVDFKKSDKSHCDSYRHCQIRCPYGNSCIHFHDKTHIKEEDHPFSQPCPFTPFHCPAYTTLSEAADARTVPISIQQHCLDYAHVCRFGRNCSNDTPLHQQKSIHIARCLCSYDGKCNRIKQDEHLNSVTHKNIADIRRVCKYADKCVELQDTNHIVRFRHARSHEESGIVRYYGLNSGINFVQNQLDSIKRVSDYVKNQKWTPLPSDNIPRQILDWFRTVRPVHRCNPVIFESILLHGHVMSRDYMENLKKPKFVATSVMQHSRIRRIDNLHIAQYASYVKEYIIAIVTAEFDKANFPPPAAVPAGDSAPPPAPTLDAAAHDKIIKAKEKTLSKAIPSTDLDVLKNKAIEIAQASIKLHTNPAGIGHDPDKELGTHRRVFSILGPHLGHYYGDVFIVFKREILHHPDADYSMLAATTFGHSGNAYKWRPWLGTAPADPKERIDQYHNSKLHASIPGHEYAIALELMAITSQDFKLKSMDISLDTIIDRWLKIDSHKSIEAHLPQLIPVDYIDYIYMPKNIFESFNSQTRRSIDALFKHCIDITSHNGATGNAMGPTGPQPASPERADYQKYVIDKLLDRCKQDVQSPPGPFEGATITIPASNFNDSFVLPLTISQAHDLYRAQHKKDPHDDIAYIYWQAINGDMMLVLSNEIIETDETKKQPGLRCLLCYIAPKSVALYDYHYHEETTYLNCGEPFRHHAFVKNNQYKAHSNTFHVGSNTDDFITYCLEIHRSTGKVVLCQAGSNAIYNRQAISCEFKNKKELDLTKLEYVNVAANTKAVTVRNLVVCFEKQAELHPKFDKNCKKAAPVSPSKTGGGHIHAGSSLKPCPENVNCLVQYETGQSGKEHNSKFSHPCRFSELCRNKEPYLTHDPHPSPSCPYDQKCKKLGDPYHRAEYRHKDLPDFLVPCRDKKCPNKSDDHLIKYSHGESVYQKKGAAAGSSSDDPRPPCMYGSKCPTIADSKHRAQYSHRKSDD